jgi:hypothetical protein
MVTTARYTRLERSRNTLQVMIGTRPMREVGRDATVDETTPAFGYWRALLPRLVASMWLSLRRLAEDW